MSVYSFTGPPTIITYKGSFKRYVTQLLEFLGPTPLVMACNKWQKNLMLRNVYLPPSSLTSYYLLHAIFISINFIGMAELNFFENISMD